ncbi:MAG TPA: hypothetical protein DCG54_05210 [Anaerolineae bacterium]|jgi:hypothetical protein|nr:hypothetical protein [Anaerolineae bacterium]
MKTSRKILILAIIVLLVGLGVFCLGLVLDPFSLPFQDYEQMPPAMQQTYETRAARMQIVRLSGCGMAVLALLTIPAAWLLGRRWTQG